ncbi:MAG: hypothetical protein Q9220_001981 [cf. Caloplaca sp. 1 TL-2023]
MSSAAIELAQNTRERGDLLDPTVLPTSPPAIEHQESIQNALAVNQSPSARCLGTPPQHYRNKSVIPTNPAATTTPSTNGQQRPTSSPSSLPGGTTGLQPTQGSYFSSQPGTSGIEARSPANRRAPASRSSHGIPTSNGPPPALITQRSYHGDPWRNPPSVEPSNPSAPASKLSQPKATARNLARSSSNSPKRKEISDPEAMSGNADSRATSHRQRYSMEEEEDDTLRSLRVLGGHRAATTQGLDDGGNQGEDHSYSSHEDLFLHLARAESDAGNIAEPVKANTRRGSQVGLSTFNTGRAIRSVASRPASSGQDVSRTHLDDQAFRWPRADQLGTPINGSTSSPRDRTYAASAHPLDQRKPRYLHSELSSKASFATPRVRHQPTQETSPENLAAYGRRQSIAEPISSSKSRSYNQSGRSYITTGQYNSSPTGQTDDRTRMHQSVAPDDTESTVSTTAPSTVWDELDDLKSRIRKLELTGKLPSSSGAAIAGALSERPRTATTTMTTASSSPKAGHAKNASPEASTVKGSNTPGLHPLLQSALAKSKPLIEAKAYKALESTAADALALAALSGNTKFAGEQASKQGRQIRRKADGICRGLTELCIALSEEKSTIETFASSNRPESKGLQQSSAAQTPNSEDPQRFRASSQDPDRPSSRIMSRLEARRTSLLVSNTPPSPNNLTNNNDNDSDSPIIHHQSHTPTQPSYPPSSRLDRTSSVLLHRRRTNDGTTDLPIISDNNNNASSRSVSRTATTTTDQRPSPRTRLSRSSQNALPTLKSLSQREQPTSSPPSTSSPHNAFPFSSPRRSYLPSTSTSNSPSTPYSSNVQPGARRYLSSAAAERRTPMTTREIADDGGGGGGGGQQQQQRAAVEARQARIASLGQYSSGRRLRLVEGGEGG